MPFTSALSNMEAFEVRVERRLTMSKPASVHLPGFPPEQYWAIQQQLTRPTGSFLFVYSPTSVLFEQTPARLILLQVPAGKTVFRLEKSDAEVSFLHASPGHGTRVATLDMSTMPRFAGVRFILTWSDDGIDLYAGSAEPGQTPEPAHATGRTANGRILVVAEDGSVVEVGSGGVRVMGYSVRVGGKKMLEPPAIATWDEVTLAVEPVLGLIKPDTTDHLLKAILGNQSLSMLVTGFETYCKKRFVEVIGEGRKSDYAKLATKVFSAEERNAQYPQLIEQEAITRTISPIELVVSRGRINFQAYDRCKTAYSAAYAIQFGDMGLPNGDLQLVQQVIGYRHRIIHVSPIIGMLNAPEVPPQQPVFAGYGIGVAALRACDAFIRALHKKTLQLPPANP